MILRGKKGIYFTIIAVVLVSVLFFSLQSKNEFKLSDRNFLTESRVGSANYFVKSLKTIYVPEAIKISSYKAAKAIFSDYKDYGGSFTRKSANLHFSEIVSTGSVDQGGTQIPIQDYINASTSNPKTLEQLTEEYNRTNLNYLFGSISEESHNHLNAELNLTYDNINISPDSGSSDHFIVDAFVNFSVITELANWTVSDNYSVRVNKKNVNVCFNDSDRSCFPT